MKSVKWEPQNTLCSFPSLAVLQYGKKTTRNVCINVFDSLSYYKVFLVLQSNETETTEIDIESFEVRRSLIEVPTLFSTKHVSGVLLINKGTE